MINISISLQWWWLIPVGLLAASVAVYIYAAALEEKNWFGGWLQFVVSVCLFGAAIGSAVTGWLVAP